jgi:TonB family protein
MLDQTPKPMLTNGDAGYARKQRRRMWLAIVLLVGALGVVLIKDHQLWFNSDDGAGDEETSNTTTTSDSTNKPKVAHQSVEKPKKETAASQAVTVPDEAGPSIIENARAAVRPLDVQVVSGNRAHVVKAGSNTLQVEIPAYSGIWTSKWAAAPSVTNAAERVALTADARDVPQQAASSSYPLLSKQMRVRGAVVLEALVGADGNIEDLRVVSGPTMLASAAREVLRQWKFKPYLQNGQPVETQAKITVNFLISAS